LILLSVLVLGRVLTSLRSVFVIPPLQSGNLSNNFAVG